MTTATPDWSLENIVQKLQEIKNLGYIPIPKEQFRRDEGVVGQLLERKFNVCENNLSIRDLGSFELKGIRSTTTTITLCHKKPFRGASPIQVFERFGKVSLSRRDHNQYKKKLFCTITGTKPNPDGLILVPDNVFSFSMYCTKLGNDEFICQWDLTEQIKKIDNIILVIAEKIGATNSPEEKFHYTDAWVLDGIKNINDLITEGIIVVDFCIDQPYLTINGPAIGFPHDRGPHIRIPKSKILRGYNKAYKVL